MSYKSWRDVKASIDSEKTYQVIDGFGVNINSKYFKKDALLPIMELLTDELAAVLYRVDIYGKSDWIDPNGSLGKEKALSEDNLKNIYMDETSKSGWEMIRYLNSKGIAPYLTCSGDVPEWMLGEDGETLTDYDSFCDMLVSLVDWACNKEELKIAQFGPLNETDIGSPEGPTVNAGEYAKICVLLDKKLKAKGLNDIKLVVAEQAIFNSEYVAAFVKHEELADRVGVFGLHTYGDLKPENYKEVYDTVSGSKYENTHMWMSEYGDLDQTGEKEWYVSWKSAARLIDCLAHGFNGAMQWDAYDNHHDHDDAWTIYGLVRYARRVITPKKRFYAAKNLYRYVRPGFVRIGAESASNDVKLLAFMNPGASDITVVGMNTSADYCNLILNFDLSLKDTVSKKVHYFLTNESDNCVKQPDRWFGSTYGDPDPLVVQTEAIIPPYSIFTLTTLD